MTPTPSKALVIAALLAVFTSTPSDAARQNQKLISFKDDPHARMMPVYQSIYQKELYPGPGQYERKVKRKNAGPSARNGSLTAGNRNAVRSGDRRAEVHQWGGGDLVSRARSYVGMSASQVGGIRRTLWCSAFMRKLTGASGVDDRAISWLNKRRVTAQVGAIAVLQSRRKHVGVVSGFRPNGDPIVISGNHAGRVAESTYPRGRVYAYVMP